LAENKDATEESDFKAPGETGNFITTIATELAKIRLKER